ncbi:MAG: FAD-dependent oxidoreductase [Aquificaceae bacterium]
MTRIAVLGAGIIGLFSAFTLSLEGYSVKVITRSLEDQTSWIAGGMLAPFSEGLEGELLQLSLKSLELYPDILDALYQVSGQKIGINQGGLLKLYNQDSTLEKFKDQILYREDFFTDKTRLTAVSFKKEGYLDPTALIKALISSLSKLSVKIIIDNIVSVEKNNSKISKLIGIKDKYSADYFVICPGAWSAKIFNIPVFPTKGQALIVEGNFHPKTLYFNSTYVIPRRGFTYIGATSEPKNFTHGNTIGGILNLINGFLELFPEALNPKISKTLYGFRPSTPDNLPVLEFGENFALLTGHHRNGILLAPASANLLLSALLSGPISGPFGLSRFSKAMT